MERRFQKYAQYLLGLTATLLLSGCGFFHSGGPPPYPPGQVFIQAPPPNPIQIGDQDPVLVWNQIIDTVDDYFRIEKEQAVQKTGDQWLEGRLESFPEIGATYLEPWRPDSVGGYERLQSTLQTVRRKCIVRAVPGPNGYAVSVEVQKQLEDVDRSQFSSDGSASQRHDGTMVRTDNFLQAAPITLGWIELGRDIAMEQRILQEIAGKLTNVEAPSQNPLHFLH